ncbi:hypothetical protein VTN77DRAFT_1798 [Rasamsonia byssochlamydoides]|uniref:uncharacterized protein n=1 Tax=Rasamsonia byssochlamydoides TaxID=89139 RepID=UPI0037434C9B
MLSTTPSENGSKTPRALHPMRSFTRMETSSVSPFARSRAKTIQTPTPLDTDSLPLSSSPDYDDANKGPDIFEERDSIDSDLGSTAAQSEQRLGDGSDALPIELASLSDRFVESLSAKTHPSPPSIDKISAMFQEFYVRAESHIATHISTLASRINRDASPHPPGTNGAEKAVTDHQMLTASEVTERRKARKQLAYKRVALEETVERRVCESVYDKIWRHKSTLDEVRDEKLRSKTAALSLLGIGLKDLGIEVPTTDEEKQEEADRRLSAARESLMKMNDEGYPLGKLQHLISAHKSIVDALTILLPSSSSADEILPTLIYCLTTCPPEGINVISNLLFIQRFRSASKIDGEAAYCLTNLEAAISFLEAVDLSSLSAETTADGQPRLLNAMTTPSVERLDSPRSAKEASLPATTSASATPEFSRPTKEVTAAATLPKAQLSVPSAQQRRLSNLFQPPAKVLGAANDAVRNTADQGLKNISTTLDNSFNFLFGRLKELQSNQRSGPVVPKTLDEARRLVTSPTVISDKGTTSEDMSIKDSVSLRPEDRRRDRSVDSTKSSDSTRRPPLATRLNSQRDTSTPSPSTGGSIFTPSPVSTPLESMKNFGNTFNPLNHIPGMIRGFGRSAPETPAPVPIPERLKPTSTSSDLPSSSTLDLAGGLAKIDPPIKRFLEVQDAQDLKLGEVALLLEDYKRLATALLNLNLGGVNG